MSLRYYYRINATAGVAPVEITSRVRVYTLDAKMTAEEGATPISTFEVDDPDGDLTLPGLTHFWAIETEVSASSNAEVFHGFLADRTVKRRPEGTRVGSGRLWAASVSDVNVALGLRVLASSSGAANANRPAETDVARVQWLCNLADGQLLIDDTRFLSTAGPVSMDAVDYRGQTVFDVFNDCAQASGKNFYAWWAETVGIGIWYGDAGLTTYSSMIRLSNVLSDVDNVFTFAISEDTTLVRDPSRYYSGIYLPYDGGAVYQRNATTFQAIGLHDAVMPSMNVKSSAKAIARATRYLADLNTEDDRITATFWVPRNKVNWLREGMRVQVKASHLPGFDTFTWMRVLTRNVKEVSEELSPGLAYEETVELSAGLPGDQAPGSFILDATLRVGSASYLGLGSDRNIQYASQVGSVLPALTIGRQYRLTVTTIDCFYSPLNGYNNMEGPQAGVYNGAASGVSATGGSYNWNPSGESSLPQQVNNVVGPTVTLSNDNAPLGGGTVPGYAYTTSWKLYDTGSPAVAALDVAIRGYPISGYWGFDWTARVTVEERA